VHSKSPAPTRRESVMAVNRSQPHIPADPTGIYGVVSPGDCATPDDSVRQVCGGE